MGKAKTTTNKSYNSEFPILDATNLAATSTKGDGNCLFRALSDQVYGDENSHSEIRSKVVDFLSQNADRFAVFVGEYETFDQYTGRMAQDGVYGGNMEIVGFAEAYSKRVVIYQSDSLFIVEPQDKKITDKENTCHIAYHTWEHYSSVRPKIGPYSGIIRFDIPKVLNYAECGDEVGADEVPQWKVDIVSKSCPEAKEGLIRKLLLKNDYDQVIENLIMGQFDDDDGESASPASEPTASGDSNNTAQVAEPSKQERKLTGKQKREEKKRRVRAKKAAERAPEVTPSSDETASKSQEESVQSKIVHI